MPSKNSELRPITAKPSPGSKNICKGLWAENVVKQKLITEGFEFLAQRQKMKYGEVDLVFKKKKTIYLLEVKFLHNPWMSFQRVRFEQQQKLLFNMIHVQSGTGLNSEAYVCFVNKHQKISFVPIS